MKLFWVFVEPAAQLVALIVIFTVLGRSSGYGTSFALFLLTGIATMVVFTRISTVVMQEVHSFNGPNRIAQCGLFAPALSAMLFRFIVGIVSSIVLGICVVSWDNLYGVPHDVIACVEGFSAAAAFGFGMGLIRGYWKRFAPAFERAFSVLVRGQLFLCGAFYVPSFLPPVIRDVLAWNPVLHAVDWVRTGVYAGYPELVLSRSYLVFVALSSVALGLAMIWRNRARIME